jgi:hypothetical protein
MNEQAEILVGELSKQCKETKNNSIEVNMFKSINFNDSVTFSLKKRVSHTLV